MKKIPVLIAALLTLAESALAQIPQAPMPLFYVPAAASRVEAMVDAPRPVAPGLQYSIDLAMAAVDACDTRGHKISVQVADSIGIPVVILSGDGAGERSQLITHTKAHAVVKYRMTSTELAQMAAEDPELVREIARNPNIGVVRGGGFPLMRDGELIGVLAVSGAPGLDDVCALEALDRVPLR